MLNHPDILALNETWFQSDMDLYSIHKYIHYDSYRKDKTGGSVSTFVHSCHKSSDLHMDSNILGSNAELVFINLKENCLYRSFSDCIVGVIYRPPNLSTADFI